MVVSASSQDLEASLWADLAYEILLVLCIIMFTVWGQMPMMMGLIAMAIALSRPL